MKTHIQLKLWFAALGLILTSTAHARLATCGSWLKAFETYEDEINQQIVLKHSLYPIGAWEPNSRYDGVVLVKAPAGSQAPALEVEFISATREVRKVETFKDLKPFEGDGRLKHFDDFKAQEFLRFEQPGVYFVRLKAGGRYLCEDMHPYYTGD
jgi:hypothetical protein